MLYHKAVTPAHNKNTPTVMPLQNLIHRVRHYITSITGGLSDELDPVSTTFIEEGERALWTYSSCALIGLAESWSGDSLIECGKTLTVLS